MRPSEIAQLKADFIKGFYPFHYLDSHLRQREFPTWELAWLDHSQARSFDDENLRYAQGEFVFDILSETDPSLDKRYLSWLCKWYMESSGGPKIKPFHYSLDLPKVKSRLEKYFQIFSDTNAQYKEQAQSLAATAVVDFATLDKFIHTFDVFMARRDFSASQDARRQRDRQYVGKDVTLLYLNPEGDLRLYEILTDEADDAYGICMNDHERMVREDADSFVPPYYQIELPNGARLRTTAGPGTHKPVLPNKKQFGGFLVDETDCELNLHKLLLRHPELVEPLKPFIASRLKGQRYAYQLEGDPVLVDWGAVALAAKIPAYRDLITRELMVEGFASLSMNKALVFNAVKTTAQIPEFRDVFTKETITYFKESSTSGRRLGETQLMLSAIATVPSWSKALSPDDIRSIFERLPARDAKYSREGGYSFASVAGPLDYLMCNLAKNAEWQNIGEVPYVDDVLKHFYDLKDWPRTKTILATAVKNLAWRENISVETLNMLRGSQDNSLKASRIPELVAQLDLLARGIDPAEIHRAPAITVGRRLAVLVAA